ncbi:MAG: hypothetical protein NUW02_00380 [Candidatus Campbellbacteria bacterium]|nr:hypothetical protein [Candidatus Campbellbacteria bacterium]
MADRKNRWERVQKTFHSVENDLDPSTPRKLGTMRKVRISAPTGAKPNRMLVFCGVIHMNPRQPVIFLLPSQSF